MKIMKILDRKTLEDSENKILIKQYQIAIKMLDSAWNNFNYSGTQSSIYHLKACEERLNEIKKEISDLNISYNQIKLYTLED